MFITRRKLVTRIGLLPLFLSAASCVAATTQPSTAVAFTGSLDRQLTVTPKDLETYPSRPIKFTAPDGTLRDYTGVQLRDLILACKPLEPDSLALRQSVVIAEGADGYFAIFSWAELFINSAGDGVFLVYKRDNLPLGDQEGKIALISVSDSKPGPRYVKWLSKVTLRRLKP